MFVDDLHNRSFGPLNSIIKIENNLLKYKYIDKRNLSRMSYTKKKRISSDQTKNRNFVLSLLNKIGCSISNDDLQQTLTQKKNMT